MPNIERYGERYAICNCLASWIFNGDHVHELYRSLVCIREEARLDRVSIRMVEFRKTDLRIGRNLPYMLPVRALTSGSITHDGKIRPPIGRFVSVDVGGILSHLSAGRGVSRTHPKDHNGLCHPAGRDFIIYPY